MSGDLTLALNGDYFDAIKYGDKVREFRLRTDYWQRRLVGRTYRNVVLTRGYPKSGGVEGVTRLTRQWRGYDERIIIHPHFGSEPVEVFAIDVSVPAAQREYADA